MHRIDQPTASGGLFTDGNESTGVEATIVDAAWLNGIQESLIQFMISRGITPVKGNFTLFTQAIASAVESSSSPNFTLDNNITISTNITGLILDKTKVKSAVISFDVYRKTATTEFNSIVTLRCIYQPIANTWKLNQDELFDEAGVTFAIDAATGQISYKSSNMSGGTYAGIGRYKISRINLN